MAKRAFRSFALGATTSMLLSITTTLRPATDLGFLLHKNLARSHELALAFGRAHMFYPEASDERCTFALLLDVDPVGLVRGSGKDGGLIDQYVNDQPYAASSFLSVAIVKTLRTARAGSSARSWCSSRSRCRRC